MSEALAGAGTEGTAPAPTPPPAPASPPPSVARMAVAFLALVGLLISTYLMLHRIGLVGRLYCGIEGACETVQSSRWATFLGLVPVPLIGVLGYLVLLVLAVIGMQPAFANDRRFALWLVVLSGIAVAFTAYLTALEAFVLHAWCKWCVGSAVVIVLIFACALVDLARGGRLGAPARGEEAS